MASRCPAARGITCITKNRRTRKNARQRTRLRMVVAVGLLILVLQCKFFPACCYVVLIIDALFHQQFRGSECDGAGDFHERPTQ